MSNAFISQIVQASSLIASLAQSFSNGASILGTLNNATLLPPFISTSSPTPSLNPPWGAASAASTNPYTHAPDTGVIRHYAFTITRGLIAPDGVNKSAILVNNAFPGPLLEANWGDTFQITVSNQITSPEEGTLLHWHGLLHKGAPWNDGVPAVDLCPIAPGKSFTYTFKADLYGTSWWHSHYSAQLANGLMGPMVIYGPRNAEYDVDLGPILLSDHYHSDYHKYIDMSIGIPFQVPFSDNNLINGKMFYNCSLVTTGQGCTPNAAISKFRFQTGKVHRLRLINSGAEGTQLFAIDGHTMTVIANDFVPVVPYQTQVVILGIGQRTDILVKATGKPTGAYWMRSNLSAICSASNQKQALAAIYYPEADTTATPDSVATPYTETSCGNTALASTTPFFPMTPLPTPATTQSIDITLATNSSGNLLFFMNAISFRGNYDHPILLLAKLGNTSYPNDPQWNVYNFGSNATIRFVIRNRTPLAHPMHLHGHNFWVLAEGLGPWDGTVTNPQNPQRRDVQLLQGTPDSPGYLVIQIDADNPGVWPLHCHISWHVSSGLYINVLEQPDRIKQLAMPGTLAQTCRDWADYSGHNVVDQIDSGL